MRIKNYDIDDNINPILYINSDLQENAYHSKFIDDNKLLDGNSTEWSKDISLNFPVLNGKSVAYYAKLCYYRQENSNAIHRRVNSKNQSAFNMVFTSLDTPNLGDHENIFQQVSSPNLPFIKGELNGQTFSGVAETGANFDTNRVIFHTKMLFPKETTGEFYFNTNSGINKGFDLEGDFNQMSFLKRDTYCTTDTIQEEINTEPVKILDVSAYNGYPNNKESLFILGITQSELSALKNVTGLSTKHARNIVFEDISPDPAIDIDGKSFKKYKVNVQGMNDNGDVVVVTPAQDIFIYTNGDFIYCSKDFSDAEPEKEDNTQYIYYTKEGYCIGGSEYSNKVYLSTQQEYNIAKSNGKWSSINKFSNMLYEKNKSISNVEFSNDAYLIFHEASLTGNKNTALWIAHTVNNALNSKYNRGKNTFNQLIKTGYSSAKDKDKQKIIPANNNSQNQIYARFAMISILTKESDPTGKSYFWDGLDLLTREGELDHPKFKQYKSVAIHSLHLKAAVAFWSIPENKNKVNPNAVINSIFENEFPLKNVADGAVSYDGNFFVGARTDSQNNPKVTENLISTGFQSGTMFWTTYKS